MEVTISSYLVISLIKGYNEEIKHVNLNYSTKVRLILLQGFQFSDEYQRNSIPFFVIKIHTNNPSISSSKHHSKASRFIFSKPISMSSKMSNKLTEFSKLKTNDVQKDTFHSKKTFACFSVIFTPPTKNLFCFKFLHLFSLAPTFSPF